ncbi:MULTISPECIES: hypothetical protein [unclassified Sphingobium]|uniref:hypothetical protein n=1 Tax=unclassified Sphingobium TaxID=2611147 RepID=UPI0035A5F4E6
MKRFKFEEILESEFRWPTAGDVPFVAAADAMANANIAKDEFTRLVLMTDGYKKAADLMVEHATSNPAERDYLVCPIIFNYRQFIELSLKYVIATYGHTVGIEPIWKSHDLARLWQIFAELLQRYGTSDPDDADPIVSEVVAEFAKIDPGSYSYRYPVDTHGQPIPITYEDLYLPTLADVINGVAGYFSGTDGYLSDLQGARP